MDQWGTAREKVVPGPWDWDTSPCPLLWRAPGIRDHEEFRAPYPEIPWRGTDPLHPMEKEEKGPIFHQSPSWPKPLLGIGQRKSSLGALGPVWDKGLRASIFLDAKGIGDHGKLPGFRLQPSVAEKPQSRAPSHIHGYCPICPQPPGISREENP